MTWARLRQHGLLDTIDRFPVEWWLVYSEAHRPFWWNRFLAPGFRHVSAYKRDGRLWVAFIPSGEFLDVRVMRTDHEPWLDDAPTAVQRVTIMRRGGAIRSRFYIGPVSCVEHVKALLGFRAPFVQTPHQLYRYVRRLHENTEGTGTLARARSAAAAPDDRTRALGRGRESPYQGSHASADWRR